MPDIGIVVLIVLAGSAALAGAHRRGVERRRARRALREKPLLAAGSPEGTWVRVTGVVRAVDDQLLVAPLSGRRCVLFRAHISSGGRADRRTVHAREQFAMVPFVIDRGA